MKYNNLLIDIMNLYYRSSWVEDEIVREYKNQKYFVHGIIGSLKMIDRLMEKYLAPTGIVYYLFDNPRTVFNRQLDIDSSYKANREKMPKPFYNGVNYLELILRYYTRNSYTLFAKFTEADDWTKPLLETTKGSSLLVSSDLDWARSIDDNIHWLDRQQVHTKETFFQKYKYYPSVSSICFNKTFYGDKVDDIKPALKQLPFAYFLSIIDTYTDIYDFIEDAIHEKIPYLDYGWTKRIVRDRDKLLKNWRLVSFAPITETDIRRYITKGKYLPSMVFKLKANLDMNPKKIEKSGEEIMDEMFIGDSLKR